MGHFGKPHVRVLEGMGAHVPPFDADRVLFTLLPCVPCSPAVEQVAPASVVHGVHEPISHIQSTGRQAGALHPVVPVRDGHVLPPYFGCLVIVLIMFCVPVVPHNVALHAPFGCHPLTSQLIGIANPVIPGKSPSRFVIRL